jgi:glutamate/tyrosine decarboxylase-like PLP-dependent enzyme
VARLLGEVARAAGRLDESMRELPVAKEVRARDIRARLARYDFAAPLSASEVLDDLADLLRRFNVHVPHPRYFGLFNPTPLPPAVAGEALAAVVNPQMAVWEHSPGANEIERWTLRALTPLIGYDPDATSAHFTTGGMESNLEAVAVALAQAFPEAREEGLRALSGTPTLYVSAEGHHSLVKAAQVTGIGRAAARMVGVGADLRMDLRALSQAVDEDRAAGRLPFLVVGTAGTTAAGAIDPLPALADFCAARNLWFHVDAAWGGGALLSSKRRPLLDGIQHADSVAWDAHKWLSVPFAAGMFFTRRREAPARAFDIASGYMPARREGCEDFHRTSLQWTRRSLGLKLFAALATLGFPGYERLIERQFAMGNALRERLGRAGFRIVNDTPLPLACFTHAAIESGRTTAAKVAQDVIRRGTAWISPVRLAGRIPAVRACITSYRTTEDDLDALVKALSHAVGTA